MKFLNKIFGKLPAEDNLQEAEQEADWEKWDPMADPESKKIIERQNENSKVYEEFFEKNMGRFEAAVEANDSRAILDFLYDYRLVNQDLNRESGLKSDNFHSASRQKIQDKHQISPSDGSVAGELSELVSKYYSYHGWYKEDIARVKEILNK